MTNSIDGGVLKLTKEPALGIEYANDGFLDLVGYARDEIEENPYLLANGLIAEADIGKLYSLLNSNWQENNKVDLEIDFIHKNGKMIPTVLRGRIDVYRPSRGEARFCLDGALIVPCV